MTPWVLIFAALGCTAFGNMFWIESGFGSLINGIAGMFAFIAAEREWESDPT